MKPLLDLIKLGNWLPVPNNNLWRSFAYKMYMLGSGGYYKKLGKKDAQ